MLPSLIPLEYDPLIAKLPPRARDAHKGQLGHVVVIGGEIGFSGACRLAAEAALRIGAGKVSVATHPEHAPFLNLGCPELMVKPVKQSQDLDALLQVATVVVIGPGLGQGTWGETLWRSQISQIACPCILDADALRWLAINPKTTLPQVSILTPHPGEAAALLQQKTSWIQANRLQALRDMVAQYRAITVLKGAGSLITSHLNQDIFQCSAGTPAMATAGMGDVLTGVIAGLIAQGMDALDGTKLGVLLHSMAGELASKGEQRGLIASDLYPFLRRLVNGSLT